MTGKDDDFEQRLIYTQRQLTLLNRQAASRQIDPAFLDACLSDFAGVLERLSAEREEKQAQARLAMLYEVSRLIGSSLDLGTVLEQVMDSVIKLTGAERGFVMLLDDDGELEFRVARNLDEEERASGDFAVSRTISRRVVDQDGPILTTNAVEDPRFAHRHSVQLHNLRSIMAAPLRARGRPIGVVYVDNRIREGMFDPGELALLEALAHQAGVAIDNARLFATTDAKLQKHLEELHRLRLIDRRLSETLDLDARIAIALEWAVRLTGARDAVLGLRNPAGAFEMYARYGADDAACTFTEGATWAPNHPLVAPLLAAAPFVTCILDDVWHLSVAVRRERRIMGMIVLSKPEPFDADAEELCTRLADRTAVAIESAEIHRRLVERSAHLEDEVRQRAAELAQAREHIAAIVDNSPDAILLLGADGAVKNVNPAFREMFGYSDALFEHWTELVEVEYMERLRSAFNAAVAYGQASRVTFIARRKDGTVFDAEAAMAAQARGDAAPDVVCSVRDISAMKAAERMKDAFVANVSHELRTPITSLKVYHELLARRPEKMAVYIEHLQRETERLHRLVEDVLYLSRLDRQQIPLDMMVLDCNELVCQYAADRAALAQERKITLTCDTNRALPPVAADASLLGQVLGVILTNALNYTPPGGSVHVSLQSARFDGREWVGFEVADTGPGIPPDEMPRVFERFFRGQVARESMTPGIGLGLSIAKEIVTRHGGRIEAESAGVPGKGAVFRVWLPAAQ
ncbi:MAG: GAF domain-containing protein [Anaerolineae bacterium]|nr:GAF domain-containing protein [Anaerolineae bacterium]